MDDGAWPIWKIQFSIDWKPIGSEFSHLPPFFRQADASTPFEASELRYDDDARN